MAPTTRQTRKRQSDGESPVSKRASHWTPRCRKFPFMDLPYEVRRLVLKELLWRPSPILFKTSAKTWMTTTGKRTCGQPNRGEPAGAQRLLFPEVLVTCKQLHDEGTSILYDNTIAIQLSKPVLTSFDHSSIHMVQRNGGQRWLCDFTVLGPRYTSPSFEVRVDPNVASKISKVKISLYAHLLPEGGNNHVALNQCMKRVAGLIGSHTSWKYVDVEIVGLPLTQQLSPSQQQAADPQAFFHNLRLQTSDGQPLRPLLCLRDRVIRCTGVEESFATELIRTAALPGPNINLYDMADAFKPLVDSIEDGIDDYYEEGDVEYDPRLLQMREALHETSEECLKYVVWVMVPQFLEARQKFMEQMGAMWMYRFQRALRNDPASGAAVKRSLYPKVFRPDHDYARLFPDLVHVRDIENLDTPQAVDIARSTNEHNRR